jgi:hypothetical protein
MSDTERVHVSIFYGVQVLAGLPDEQRAAVLAARAEGALDLQDGEGDLDEVGGKLKVTVCCL